MVGLVVIAALLSFLFILNRKSNPTSNDTMRDSVSRSPVVPLSPLLNSSEMENKSISVQQEKMCDVKYPPATMMMLKRTLAERVIRRVAIASVLKDCIDPLQSLERAILQVAEVLSPENVFVSLLESGSGPEDQTPVHMQKMRDRLQAQGISNVISTGSTRTSAVWKKEEVGSRINFLARLRNAAMIPALDGHPEGHFDKVFFINDVFMCGGDMLRLLAHTADVACGLDFEDDTDQLYDKWVHSEWLFDKFNLTYFREDYKYQKRVNTPAFNVFSCWNGGIATNAALWYNGARFREGMRELGTDDCSQSECSLWSMDAHTLGYHNVVLDPSVQTAYVWKPYVMNFRDSNPEVKKAVVSPTLKDPMLNRHSTLYRCCELEGTGRNINFDDCHTRSLVTPGRTECMANTTKCLRYSPSRWMENWDWKPLLRIGNKTF